MKAGFPLTVTLTPSRFVGILPDAKSGALLQITPVAGVVVGTRFVPFTSMNVFWAMSVPPHDVFTMAIVLGATCPGSDSCTEMSSSQTVVLPILAKLNSSSTAIETVATYENWMVFASVPRFTAPLA